MYCGECGSKIKKTDTYCGECGAKVEKKENKKIPKKEKQIKLTKRKKIILGIIGAFLIILIGFYIYFEHRYSPESAATRYLDTVINGNVDEIYDALETDKDNPFVSLKKFKEIYKEDASDIEVINYKLKDVEYGEEKLTSVVTFSVVTMDDEEEVMVPLVKSEENKLLIFDNWKITNSNNSYIAYDYEIAVPKNSNVEIDGIKVDKNYLNKNQSNSSVDTYVIPEIFVGDYNIKITLENDIKINDEIHISGYDKTYTADISIDDIEEDALNELETNIKDDINTLYKNIIDKKTWEDVKENYKNVSKDLQNEYKDLYDELVREEDITLTKFSVTKVDIEDVAIEEGKFEIDFTFDYDYSIKYINYADEEKTKDDDASNSSTILYNYKDGKYLLYDIDGTVSYFSRW